MARKPVLEGGRRDEIVTAALELFFNKGYDGTSVRTIMKKAGGEIGLFYYYFKSKDDVFDKALDLFFAHYKRDCAVMVALGRRNPCRVMQDFFEYLERETELFRRQYAEKMHRMVRWAIREHTLEIIEPYLRQIVEIQRAYYGAAPAVSSDVAALYLAHGVGSAILHEDRETYQTHRAEMKRGISLLMGIPPEEQELRIPYPAKPDDVAGWMALLGEVKSFFPGLNEADYERQLAVRIAGGEAWVFRFEGTIPAALLYSKDRKELDFLAVRPDFRRKGLASKLAETAAAQFSAGTRFSVVTYREGDPAGVSARAFYRSLGFAPGEELERFGYPCQKLTVIVPDGPLGR